MSEDITIYPYEDEPNEGMSIRGYCTVNTNDERGKRVVYNALSNAAPLSAEMGKPIMCRDIMIQPGKRRNRDTGDYEECVNVYIIDVNGNAFFSQSVGVLRSVTDLLTLYPGGFSDCKDGCIVLKCVERKLMNGNTIKALVMV